MRWKIAAFCLGLAASVGAVSAHADTVTFDGSTYTLSYTTPSAGVYDVYLTIDTSGYAGGSATYTNYMDDVALQLAGADTDYTSTPTVLSAPSGYSNTVVDGGLNGSGCNASGSGFFCLAYIGTDLGVPTAGGSYQFEFQVEDSNPLGSKYGLYDNNSANVEVNYEFDNTKKGTIGTNKDNTTITMSPAPEPASIALLGTALLGMALLTKKMGGAV